MKDFGFTATILENSNTAISAGEANWSQIRPNSNIRFGSDDNFYTVVKTEEIFYIKDFTSEDGNRLIVEDDANEHLINGDSLTITYKEYELDSFSIVNGGLNYKVGNMLSVSGGTSPVNPNDGNQAISTLAVEEVNAAGGITKVSIRNRGKYTISPEEYKINGGFGSGVELKLNYRICSNRATIEREISNITHNSSNSTVSLLYSLPDGTYTIVQQPEETIKINGQEFTKPKLF